MSEVNLSSEERERYSRHLALPGFDEAAQLKLKQAKVAVIGCGGLGCPVLQYLTAAGVGHFILVDHDVVSLSNLQRQVLFAESDIGRNKTEVVAERMQALNNAVQTETYTAKLTSANALRVLQFADIIADCTDNFPTRYLLNDVAVKLNVPLVQAAIYRFEGQVSVFNHKADINYRDVYPVPPSPDSIPDCATGGVLGTLAGIIGSIQANEIIKVITGIEEVLDGKIFHYDARTNESHVFQLKKNENNSVRSANRDAVQLIDYEQFCNSEQTTITTKMINEISVQELKTLMDNKEHFQFIDVRESSEFNEANLGAELIPMNTIPDHVNEIARDKKVIIHCKAGTRSGNVIAWLQAEHGYTNLLNLKGGIMAWHHAFGK